MTNYFQYNLSGLLTLTASLMSLSVGILVLSGDWRSKLHRSFFLITATGTLWLLSIAMVQLVRNPDDAYFWITINYIFAVPYISPSVYLFSLYWNGKDGREKTLRVGFLIAVLLGLFPVIYARKVFEFAPVPGGRFDRFTPTVYGQTFYWLIMSLFSIYATLAFRNFVQAWRNSLAPNRRAQCRIFTIAALIGYTGSVDFLVAHSLHIYPFGYISFSGFVLLVAYAIVRHRFLNIDIFIKKFSLVLLIYSFLIAIVLPFTVPVLKFLLTGTPRRIVIPLLLLSVGVGLALSLGPIIYSYLNQRSSWIRNGFTAGLTHELKSPLCAIQSAIEALECTGKIRFLRPDDNYLKMIRANAERLDSFVRDLLSVVQIQEGAISLRRDPVDLRETARREVEAHRSTANAQLIVIDYRPNGPVTVEGDEEKLRQVLSNVLSNAVKFSRPGGRIELRLYKKENEAVCAISDWGSGVSKESLAKIFERFYSGTNASKGAGLGLAIAKGWVEAHGGRIWAESEGEGKGTTVTFTLPESYA